MKKYLSLVLLAFVIAVGSIITSLVLPNNSLLSPSPATAQQADIRNGYVWLTLPSTGNQDDSWSCGPNSAARVLAFYGHQVNYNTVRSVAQFDHGIIPTKICVGSGILKTCVDTSRFKTGLEPNEVLSVMSQWERGIAKYESGADFGKIKSLLSQGKPVLVLRRVGSIQPGRVFGTWPAMHWVAVHGYNDQEKKIYFTDTDGGTYEKSYDEFLSEWDWRIGRGLASETFHRKGVKPKTMVWVDRTPPSLASSSIPITGIPISVNSGNTLFYDRSNGVCAFRASDGSVIQRLTTCRRTWHSIVYTAGTLLFYDRDAGQIETYRVGNQGLGEQLHSYAPGSMRRTWAQITSPQQGIIVFRDDNGQVETYRLNDIGMLQGL